MWGKRVKIIYVSINFSNCSSVYIIELRIIQNHINGLYLM